MIPVWSSRVELGTSLAIVTQEQDTECWSPEIVNAEWHRVAACRILRGAGCALAGTLAPSGRSDTMHSVDLMRAEEGMSIGHLQQAL